LSLWKLADHIVVNHDSEAVLVDMQNAHDAGWVEVILFGNLPHQVPYSALSKVDGTVVIGLLVSTGEVNVKACNCNMVSKRKNFNSKNDTY
jgi:hypothetical protein